MLRIPVLVAIAAFAVGLWIAIVLMAGPAEPRLLLDESVADDFGELADETWESFVAAFPAQRECIGAVTLVAVYDLDDRAKYDADRAQMAIRVPGPPVVLQRAIIHELAHHLEFSCDAHLAIRPAFLTALGWDPETPWFEGQAWEDIPSEVFAEAVVEVVYGDFDIVHPRIGLIPAEAVEVVMNWGGHTEQHGGEAAVPPPRSVLAVSL